jgi:hypothetical protein
MLRSENAPKEITYARAQQIDQQGCAVQTLRGRR